MQARATVPSDKRSSKGSKRRLRFLIVPLLCFLCWAGVTVWDQFGKLHAKGKEVEELRQQLADAQKLNEDTKREMARLHDDEYLEQIIRRDFHYTRTGETPLSVSRPQP